MIVPTITILFLLVTSGEKEVKKKRVWILPTVAIVAVIILLTIYSIFTVPGFIKPKEVTLAGTVTTTGTGTTPECSVSFEKITFTSTRDQKYVSAVIDGKYTITLPNMDSYKVTITWKFLGSFTGGDADAGTLNLDTFDSRIIRDWAGFDSDNDGLLDWEEKAHGTDPYNWDTDGDFVNDGLEVRNGSNPLKIDTDGGGLDDFNEIFTYGMNPNDPSDDLEFMKKIPHVEARLLLQGDLGVGWSGALLASPLTQSMQKQIIISMRDPLIRWYAERTEIRWENDSEGKEVGRIYTDGKPIWTGYGMGTVEKPMWGALLASYYFTVNERCGVCFDSALVNHVILKLMGYKCIMIKGIAPLLYNTRLRIVDHGWNEVYIDGKVYIVDFNNIFLRDFSKISGNETYLTNFYILHGWTIEKSENYDPEWYKKENRNYQPNTVIVDISEKCIGIPISSFILLEELCDKALQNFYREPA